MAEADPTKWCSQCKTNKPLDSFARDRSRPDGLCNTCKACKYAYKQAWQLANRHKAIAYRARYRFENRERLRAEAREKARPQREARLAARAERKRQKQAEREAACHRNCSLCNRPFHSTSPKRYCSDCKRLRRLADKARARKQETPEQAKKRRLRERRRYEVRYRSDLKYQVSQRFRVALRRTVTDKGGRSAFTILGYTQKDLIRRLKQTMPAGYSWRDVLSGALHIDHIIPVAAFDFSSVDDPDFHRCWALSNLQLLPAADNLKKNDTLTVAFQPLLFPRYQQSSIGSRKVAI